MKTGNVLQTIKPKKEVYRFCLDVGHTKCIIGKSSIIDSLKLIEDPYSRLDSLLSLCTAVYKQAIHCCALKIFLEPVFSFRWRSPLVYLVNFKCQVSFVLFFVLFAMFFSD